MKKIKCLIVDTMHPSIIPMLSDIGLEVSYQPLITKAETVTIINDFDGIIIRSKFFIDKEFLEVAPNLQFIARAGAGIDNLDIIEIEKRNIHIINAPEGNRDTLAEHTMGMLLTLFNRINIADSQVRNKKWDREGNRGFEIMNKTIALLGYGHMGQSFAKRLSSFGCKVIAYDKYKSNFTDKYVTEVQMDSIYNEADILSLHIPLTSETKLMIDNAYINRFKKNIWLLNTARGEIISNKVILDNINSGKIKGAALDVLENEKIYNLNESEQSVLEDMLKSDKILFSPHIAGWSFESYERINTVIKTKILDFINKTY